MLDEVLWSTACIRVLTDIGTGVLACDASLAVLKCTARAEALLEPYEVGPGRALPVPIAAAARSSMAAPARRAVRVDGRSELHVTAVAVFGLSPVEVVVALHEELQRDAAVIELLRENYKITVRDAQLVRAVLQGHTNKQIARLLGLTASTVKSYMHRLFEVVGVHSRAELLGVIEQHRARM